MRILLVSALSILTAACVAPPPPAQTAAAPPPPTPLVGPAPPPPTPLVAPAPPPAVVAAPAPAPQPYVWNPLAWLFGPPPAAAAPAPAVLALPNPFALFFGPPEGGRLVLSNFSYDRARVQAMVTPYPDCAVHDGVVAAEKEVPLNGTWVVAAAPGADVCWRRAIEPNSAAAVPGGEPGWTGWSRVYLSTGRTIDSQL